MGVVLIIPMKVEVIKYHGNVLIHKQIEKRGKLWFMRLKKRTLVAE